MRKLMVGVLGAAAFVAGCGSSGSYRNDPRPPQPILLAVSVTNQRVTISPSHVGAGPVVLTVSNISSAARDLTLDTPPGQSGGCIETNASSGPVNPQGTARLPVELVEGDCLVRVKNDDHITPARLTVGGERASAQSQLLLP